MVALVATMAFSAIRIPYLYNPIITICYTLRCRLSSISGGGTGASQGFDGGGGGGGGGGCPGGGGG